MECARSGSTKNYITEIRILRVSWRSHNGTRSISNNAQHKIHYFLVNIPPLPVKTSIRISKRGFDVINHHSCYKTKENQ